MASGTVARHMYTLYKEMIEECFGDDGCDMTLSENHGYPVQAHHCISCSVISEIHSRDMARLAEESGYDVNNGNNGIALPAYFGHQRKETRQRHRGGHWDTYYKNVEKTLNPIYEKYKATKPCKDEEARKKILGALQTAENKIKGKLIDRTWWLYDWSKSLWSGDYRDEGTGNLNSARKRDGSSTTGQQWLIDTAGDIKRRYEEKGGKKTVREKWYDDNGYPVPGSLR